jgi:hypothetical protein
VTLVYCLAGTSLLASDLTGSYRPIAGAFLIVPLLVLAHLATVRHLRRWQRRIVSLVDHGLDAGEFANVARRLDWGPIPARMKERWLEAVVNGRD